MPAEQTVGELLAALGERTAAPASGAAVALAAAMAAALVEMVARFAADEAAVARAGELSARLVELSGEDGEAYAAFMATKSEEARRRTIEIPQEVAARAEEAAELAARLRTAVRPGVAGDAEVAESLARTAAEIARRLAAMNL